MIIETFQKFYCNVSTSIFFSTNYSMKTAKKTLNNKIDYQQSHVNSLYFTLLTFPTENSSYLVVFITWKICLKYEWKRHKFLLFLQEIIGRIKATTKREKKLQHNEHIVCTFLYRLIKFSSFRNWVKHWRHKSIAL